MKKIVFLPLLLAVMLFLSCGEKSKQGDSGAGDTLAVQQVDTAYYGVGGIGTSMHSLMLVTDAGDTLVFAVVPPGEPYDADEPAPIGDADVPTSVVGGMPNAGDRVSVVAFNGSDEPTARQVVNLTSLQGRWNSIERNFEICEGGVVKQQNQTERAPWTEWKMCNGQLILGADTFSINALTHDSLLIENHKGIYAYTRKN